MEMRRATLRAFDAGAYKATVEVAGSIAVWLTGVPVARTSPRGSSRPDAT